MRAFWTEETTGETTILVSARAGLKKIIKMQNK
jgi:hypothetical protein